MKIAINRNLWWLALAMGIMLISGCEGNQDFVTNLDKAHRLSDAVNFLRNEHEQPALGAALIKGDKVQLALKGFRKEGEHDFVNIHDYFHIGSNAKAMSALMIGRLVQSGELEWSTRPVDVFPELAGVIDPGYAAITLEQILSHEAGLPALDDLETLLMVPMFEGTAIEQRKKFSAWVLSAPPAGPLGEFSYSNAGYVIAAMMAEQVTDDTWEELMNISVYAPLGISARIGWPAKDDPNQPWGHEEFDGIIRPHNPLNETEQMPLWLTPAGDVSMSLGDYAEFIKFYLGALRGEQSWVPGDVLNRLESTTHIYCLGWAVMDIDGARTYLHDGSSGTFYLRAEIIPSEDRAIVIVTNAVTSGTADAILELEEWMLQQ